MKQYDTIIIGSGQAANPLAKKLAAAGRHTLLLEATHIGGTCINTGCTPTKTMIAAARMQYIASRASRFGIPVETGAIDLTAVVKRKNEIVASFRGSLEKSLEKTANLEVVREQGVFTGTKTVNGRYTAEHIFINTGARPVIPPIPGIHEVPYCTSAGMLDLQKVPEHLVVLGSGYIAMELGQMYRRFGSQVTIIERGSRILGREDEDVAAAVHQVLEEDGIRIITHASVERAAAAGNGHVRLTLQNGQRLEASHWLIATGRAPATEALQLEKTGITPDEQGFIPVNEYLETSVPGIYALGDVKKGPAFTHISYNDYIVVAENILNKKNISIKDRPVPYCMFTDPELGRIGITEQEAREKGLAIKIARLPLSKVARAIETGETRGLIKAVVDAQNGQVLGAAVLSVSGGEIMTVLQMAMMGNIGYKQLRNAIFAHPLFSESLNNLFMTLDDD
ncbi:FAD-containing oxidoreductase [Chitinophaga alhagiae]|uniref:FAD-containing oxidoreductase n=1 Tax=Chitinophaga alhagiae TaxID=2203219 RepID=A0ABM6WE56_9BACT|nr:mercuric reductase [Chitinophaga alhagiae]AWO02234.1 FAD-containing oxidoreductase [Chitinophaga alhagiae]